MNRPHSATVASPRTLYSTPGFGLVCIRTPTAIPSAMHFMRPRFVVRRDNQDENRPTIRMRHTAPRGYRRKGVARP